MNIPDIISDFQSAININDDEVALFRELATSIKNNSTNTIFINETHGNKAQVKFKSQFIGKNYTRCEVSDLLIVSRNLKSNLYRATFLQAKKETSDISSLHTKIQNFVFKGQYNQWELLAHRPVIIEGVGKFKPYPEFLSDALSPSIGSFGVFYEEKKKVEFIYSVAEFISVVSKAKHPKMIINEMLINQKIDSAPGEAIVNNNLKTFLFDLSTFKIGSLIDITRASDEWLFKYIYSKAKDKKIEDFFDDDTIETIKSKEKLDDSKNDGISLLLIMADDEFANRANEIELELSI